MRIEYVLQDEKFNELRSFLKKGGQPGDVDMMTVEAIPGTMQSPLNIIRFIVDTGKIDDYGKPITERQIIIDNIYDKRSDRMSGIFPYDLDKNITITGISIQYEFYHTPNVEQYFKEKYYDDITMMLYKLKALDPGHNDDLEVVFTMIREIQKE